jgi:serine/threonine protein kinase
VDRRVMTPRDRCQSLCDKNFEPEQVQKIRMSIALFKLLRHPALIDIKDVFESASKFFVVIPQLPGISYLGLVIVYDLFSVSHRFLWFPLYN